MLAGKDSTGERRLVAYVVPEKGGSAPQASALREYLAARLPDYMVPAAFVGLESLPLTANGKVDRKALPSPGLVAPQRVEAPVAPRNRVEELVAASWAAALGLEVVGVHDNFFELGGHSIAAAQLLTRLNRTFGVELPLRGLFEAPTVAGLANLIEAMLWAPTAAQPVGGTEAREEIEL